MNGWVFAVDLGGTKIEIGLVSPENRIVGRQRIPTRPTEGPQRVVERIAACVEALGSLLPPGQRADALGMCSPGPVDHETGTLIDPPNLAGLHNSPLADMLARRLEMPVHLEHDAKAAALGEYHYGAGRGEPSLVYIVVGTGVGAAIIQDGQLVRGQNNSAGEIGHVTLDKNGERCSCGSRGCVETYLSGPWLARRYEKRAGEAVGGDQVIARAGRGDPLALQVVAEAGDALGTAIATLAMVLNIDLYVVGGSVAKSGDVLLEPTRRALPDHAYRSVGCGVRVLATELGDDGPLLGCAYMARQAAAESAAALVGLPATVEATDWALVEGVVLDIQRFSVHDGPGIRTNVFLKGCPLRCPWCANPESQRLHPELMLSAQTCARCGQFQDYCVDEWGAGGWTQALLDKYGQRPDVCPTCAVRWVGGRRTARDVIAEVQRDAVFYQGVGGLTLTGGEPTFQPRFAEALLRLAKAEGLTTAMETSGHTRWAVLERLLPHLDHVLYDFKHIDPEKHRAHTGVDNALILSNLRRLVEVGAPVSIRVPLIPGFNVDDLDAMAAWVRDLGCQSLTLLPYHTYGRAKYTALGRDYAWEQHARLDAGAVRALADSVRAHGLAVHVGG
ncbi:MAG: glycyl-radical enzyme activating protein [Anaerolineae bacterium]|nr:glycyl-radical enzyme activating protein [Anaerolineae bacterium]